MIDRFINNILLEQLRGGELPPKKTPKSYEKILSQIKLFEMYPRVFAVVIKDDYLRSRVFLRYQEFYESDSDSFRGQGFKWKDFIRFYKEKTKNEIFTYHEDWSGYNIPCDSIESCMKLIPDLNFFDLIMYCIVDTVKQLVGSDKFYLIGIDQSTGDDPHLIYHEMAHALWFSDPSYKEKMSTLIRKMDSSVREKMLQKISDSGYGNNVLYDELQAYMATGLVGNMNRIKGIKLEIDKFKNFFDTYTNKFKAKEIPIDWSLHF